MCVSARPCGACERDGIVYTQGPDPPIATEVSVPLDADEARRRATAGAAVLGARGVAVYVVGIVANLVLAGLLAPRDFGLVALGTVVVMLGTLLTGGGFGPALIRRPVDPTEEELRGVMAVQLTLTLALAAAAAVAAVPLGREGAVVAVMAASLPIVVLRTPSLIVLERRLLYRTIATTDLVEAVAYYAWAVASVAAGFGVWGLATAVVVRATAGTATMLAMGPTGLVRPRWSLSPVRPLLGLGARFQVATVLAVAREQVLNVGVAAVGGLGTLGVWNLAWRVLQVPNLLFATVGRVGFPLMSRLLEADRDPRPVIERGMRALAVLASVAMVGIVGMAQALPSIVGGEWKDTAAVLLWAATGLIVNAPVTVVLSGYLFAAGSPGAVAVAMTASACTWLAVALPLVGPMGPAGVGVGLMAAGGINALFLWRRCVPTSAITVTRPHAAATAGGLAGVAVAWQVADAAADTVAGGVLGVAAGEAVVVVTVLVLARPAVNDLMSLTVRSSSRRLDPRRA